MSPRLVRLVPALIAVLACAAAFAGPAAAKTPCWKVLLNDWYDGTINNVYPIHCYHDAIKHLPTDVQVYSSARDDINRALQAAIRGQRTPKTSVTTGATEPTTTTSGKTTSTKTSPNIVPLPNTTTTKKKNKGPISKAIRDITPGGADSFPLPLLILGLLAILLVLAGVGGMIWRRYQGRGSAP